MNQSWDGIQDRPFVALMVRGLEWLERNESLLIGGLLVAVIFGVWWRTR